MSLPVSNISWEVILILLPLMGGLLCFLWPRLSRIFGLATLFGMVFIVIRLGVLVHAHGVLRHRVGGWEAPLGIQLHVDGLSLVMLAITAMVGLAAGVYSQSYFKVEDSRRFWPLFLFLLAALNAVFLSADIFNIYVALELKGLSAVALTALPGNRDALRGAMRYLLATLLGSLLYLFGVALLYHGFGTVDIALFATRLDASPVTWAATGLMGAGLLMKTALFPLHFWLPPAHSSAPAPVSALLSALVVKAAFYILLRLWLTMFHSFSPGVEQLFGLLGAAAIILGSLQALRQARLKMLVAYSTVAQIGYLFLTFPLAAAAGFSAWNGAIYLAFSHAVAKASMFLAAGNLMHFAGHDRICDLEQAARRLPLSLVAFALAGISIMGLPPSGGFIGKWQLLEAAIVSGRWDLAAIMVLGGLLAAGYVFKVLSCAFSGTQESDRSKVVPAGMEWTALLLAFSAILLGFLAPLLLLVTNIGDPFGIGGVRP